MFAKFCLKQATVLGDDGKHTLATSKCGKVCTGQLQDGYVQNLYRFVAFLLFNTSDRIIVGKANRYISLRRYQSALAEAEKAKSAFQDAEKGKTSGKDFEKMKKELNCSAAYTAIGISHEALKSFDLASASYTVSIYNTIECYNGFQNAIQFDPDDAVAKRGLARCLKASFAVRNGSRACRERIERDDEVQNILKDPDVIDFVKGILIMAPR